MPPTIMPLQTASAGKPGRAWFRVTRAGTFAGRRFHVGDVLVCGGTPKADAPVVLVPVGRGRPRLGTVDGCRLFGDVGEPCSPVRWRPVGRVLTVLASVPARSSVQAEPGGAEPQQLTLFSRAA